VIDVAALLPGGAAAPVTGAPAGRRAATPDAAGRALLLRDRALAALGRGDPGAALDHAGEALAVLGRAGLASGPDAAAVLVARAEIEESVDRFGAAAGTIAAAVAMLDDAVAEDGGTGDSGAGDSGDCLLLWCQAQERSAGLDRLAGEFGAAAARLTMVLDRAAAAFGAASPPVARAANALGVVHKHAGDFDAAQAAYRRAMAAAEADPDPLVLAGLLHNLGGLAHARGDATAGIPLAERGLSMRERVLGAGHPDVARDLNALGALYHLAGRLGDAAQAYQRALAVFEEHYRPDHYEVAMTCANLAVLHGDQGRPAAAEALGRRSLRILAAILGPQDAEVGLTLLNLAVAVADQGRQAEAAALAVRASAVLTARLPAGHPHVLAAGQVLDRLGRPS